MHVRPWLVKLLSIYSYSKKVQFCWTNSRFSLALNYFSLPVLTSMFIPVICSVDRAGGSDTTCSFSGQTNELGCCPNPAIWDS